MPIYLLNHRIVLLNKAIFSIQKTGNQKSGDLAPLNSYSCKSNPLDIKGKLPVISFHFRYCKIETLFIKLKMT